MDWLLAIGLIFLGATGGGLLMGLMAAAGTCDAVNAAYAEGYKAGELQGRRNPTGPGTAAVLFVDGRSFGASKKVVR